MHRSSFLGDNLIQMLQPYFCPLENFVNLCNCYVLLHNLLIKQFQRSEKNTYREKI